jgi:uncharacterized protein (DUF2062 family)
MAQMLLAFVLVLGMSWQVIARVGIAVNRPLTIVVILFNSGHEISYTVGEIM